MVGPRTETADGFESHLGTNHLGPFLLTLLLLPALRRGAAQQRAAGARIVSVSSMTHHLVPGISLADPHLANPGKYTHEAAYSQSKLAQVMFTSELRRRLHSSTNVCACVLHPGMVATDVVRSLPEAVQRLYRLALGWILLTPAQGARATLHAATAPSAPAECKITHGYFDANCAAVMPAAVARDASMNLLFWRWSAEQVQLPPEYNLPEVQ